MAKVVGIGIDIVDINRFSKTFKRNKKFKKRIFTKSEIKFCDKKNSKISCFAKRFAAKEAFSKALGTGISQGLNFNEIGVKNDLSGKPTIYLEGNTKKIVNNLFKGKKINFFISLSDEKKFAIAMIVITAL